MKRSITLTKASSIIITLGYLLLGGAWSIYSKDFLYLFSDQLHSRKQLSELCYWWFIILSSGLLYTLLQYLNLSQSKSSKSLFKLNRALKSYSECTKALLKVENEQVLIRDICQICVEVGGHKMAWVAFADDDESKTLRPISYWGTEGHFFQNFRASWAESECGKSLVGTTIRTGDTVIYQNLKDGAQNNPCHDAAVQCGYASCISLPLKGEDGIYGALVIFSERANAFDTSEAFLLKELADDLSYGIRMLRVKEEHRREAEERSILAAVTDQTSDGIITFDSHGIIQYINPSFSKLCGISAEESIGVSIHDFECSKRNQEFYKAVISVFETRRVRTGHFINKSRNGVEHDIEARISPVFDKHGQILRYVVTVMDVSQQVMLQRQLRQAQKVEALDTLACGITNDFNDLLDNIGQYSELALIEDAADVSAQENLLRIFKETVKGRKLIEQFTTINEQRAQPRQKINISDVIKTCFAEIEVILPSIIKLHTDITPGLGFINGDREEICQVIKNICRNGIDAMQTVGGILEVGLINMDLDEDRICHYPGLTPGGYARLTITDTGHGMNRDEQERVFDPFYTTKDGGRGRGLGLSIAQRIIKNHGGDISVNSIVGVGTTFTILLPLSQETKSQVVATCT